MMNKLNNNEKKTKKMKMNNGTKSKDVLEKKKVPNKANKSKDVKYSKIATESFGSLNKRKR